MAQSAKVNASAEDPAEYDENLTITTTDAYADATATVIDARHIDKGVLEILSKHATNGITYKIRGSNKAGSTAPGNTDTSWVPLVTDVAIAANQTESKKESWSEPLSWLRVDIKATSAGNQGTVDVRSRGMTK